MIFWDNTIKRNGKTQCLFICNKCKLNFFLDKTDLKRKKSSFCGKCYKKSQEHKDNLLKSLNNKPTIKKLCQCGSDFNTKNSRKKFCSEKCRQVFIKKKSSKKKKICDCGNTFYYIKGFSKNFCSPNCPKKITIFFCLGCNIQITERTKEFEKRKYFYCMDCYLKSPEKVQVSKENAKKRRTYDGRENPNYKGGLIKLECPCGLHFEIYPARKNTAKYCSTKCKKKYSISKAKYFEYKEYKLRSSWELAFAQYLDNKGYIWIYEPESFGTAHGFYTPDFWVNELNCYFEIKGYFRDKDAEEKFKEFSKNHNIILANKEYLLSLGFIRIKSGPRKGQLCPPVAQP